jgi:hypothetical protein
VVLDKSEAGDFLLRFPCPDAAELDELLELELDEPEEEPLLRSPLPLAQRVIACSITEGIILNPMPLEDEDEELDSGRVAGEKIGWCPELGIIGDRGSEPLYMSSALSMCWLVSGRCLLDDVADGAPIKRLVRVI